jgi:hypothetical protein
LNTPADVYFGKAGSSSWNEKGSTRHHQATTIATSLESLLNSNPKTAKASVLTPHTYSETLKADTRELGLRPLIRFNACLADDFAPMGKFGAYKGLHLIMREVGRFKPCGIIDGEFDRPDRAGFVREASPSRPNEHLERETP